MLNNPRAERVRAVRALSRRSSRQRSQRFVADGPQAVREALRFAPDSVIEVFIDVEMRARHAELLDLATQSGVLVQECSSEVLDAMLDSVQPQGVAAVCRPVDVGLAEAFRQRDGFVVVLAHVRDPGNAGTVIRGADAAGASALIVSDASVDIYNPKVVRSTAGSLWHLPISVGIPMGQVFAACRAHGRRTLAADGAGSQTLAEIELSGSHAWVMGNEAWGLPSDLRDACDEVVRVPIYGHAESLNLAMAATICMYASANAQLGDR